jgi:hypothetical protein
MTAGASNQSLFLTNGVWKKWDNSNIITSIVACVFPCPASGPKNVSAITISIGYIISPRAGSSSSWLASVVKHKIIKKKFPEIHSLVNCIYHSLCWRYLRHFCSRRIVDNKLIKRITQVLVPNVCSHPPPPPLQRIGLLMVIYIVLKKQQTPNSVQLIEIRANMWSSTSSLVCAVIFLSAVKQGLIRG